MKLLLVSLVSVLVWADQPQQKSKKAKADGRKNIESFQEVSIIFHKKKNSYKVRFG